MTTGSDRTRLIVLRGNSGSARPPSPMRCATYAAAAWPGCPSDVSFDETLRRHATRPQATEFGPDAMRGWYRQRDLLPSIRERVVPETSTLQQTVALIIRETRLLGT